MSDFEKAMNELHEDNIISIGVSAEQIEEMLNEIDPMIYVCQEVIEVYQSRSRSKLHAEVLAVRMHRVEMPYRRNHNRLLLVGKGSGFSCQISDQGATSSGSLCDCDDFHTSQFNGGQPCEHMAKLAYHYLNK